MKLLITTPAFHNQHMEPLIQFAEGVADEVVLNPYGRTLTPDELKALWDGADAIIAGLEPYTPELFSQAPDTLKAVCRFGVGYDSVDLDAAKARGIAVTNTPGTNSGAVADLTIGMMIAIARHIPQGDKSVRDGT
ncbi:MAG: phosphoglycerate dehydrogenase, partial [Bacillota bacterium]